MSRRQPNEPDPEDMFSETRMTFGEHIEDLRTHLLRALYGFLIFFLASFIVAKPVLRFIANPVEGALLEYHNEILAAKFDEIRESIDAGKYSNMPPLQVELKVKRKDLREAIEGSHALGTLTPNIEAGLRRHGLGFLLRPVGQADPEFVTIPVEIDNALMYMLELEKLRTTIKPPTLSTLSVQEAFMVYVWIAILTGLVLSSPWVFYQIWSFVAAGLYPHEKKLVHLYLPLSLTLFLAGVFICEFFVIPKAVEALLWFNKLLGLQPDLRLSEWLGFAIFMPLVFGISFQTPIVMLFVERVGVVDVQWYREKRKFAVFFLAVFAAVITPSTDVFSMLFLLIPMCLLYELGIWMCAMSPRPKFFEAESEETEDLIEV